MGFYLDSAVTPAGRTRKTGTPRSARVGSGLRYYSPGIGRWLSRDPMGRRVTPNLFAGMLNNPIRYIDAGGRDESYWPPGNNAPPGSVTPPDPTPAPPSGGDWIINEPARTEAVKNNSQVRADVEMLINNNMLAKRDKTCPEGETKVIRKPFDKTHADSYAFMYFTGFFLLGQVAVDLDGGGVYQADCCTKTFKKWNIHITGSYSDKLDELIPVPGPKKGIGSLPITFEGQWTEYHSGQ